MAVSALVTASRAGCGDLRTCAASCAAAIGTPVSSRAGVYWPGPPGSQPSTTAPAHAASRPAADAPAPADPDDVDAFAAPDRTCCAGRCETGPDLGGRSDGHAPLLRGGHPLQEHRECRLGTAPLVGRAVTRPLEPADVRRAETRDRHVDQADGLRLAPAVRAGDAGHRDPEVGPERIADAVRHRERDLRGHGAVGRQHLRGNAQGGPLHVVRVRHDAAAQVGRRTRHLRDQVRDEPAGAGLGRGHGQPEAPRSGPRGARRGRRAGPPRQLRLVLTGAAGGANSQVSGLPLDDMWPRSLPLRVK